MKSSSRSTHVVSWPVGGEAVSTGVARIARRAALPAYDSAAWTAGIAAATYLRYDGHVELVDPTGFVLLVAVTLAAHFVVTAFLQRHWGRHWTGSVDDVIGVAVATLTVGTVTFLAVLLASQPAVPRSIPLIGASIALVLSLGGRLVIRVRRERVVSPDGGTAERVIVLGAGSEGRHLVRSMRAGPAGGYLPVALLDDDPALLHQRISQITVRGNRRDIAEVAELTRATLLVIAARDLDAQAMETVHRTAVEAGLGVKVLPSLSEMLCAEAELKDLRDIDIADLLGRQVVEIDVVAIAGYLTGRRVLVTGAGGSIGSELCRQIHRFGPAELLMLDRDESGLHATQLSIHGRADLDASEVILADIRDADVLTEVFVLRRPEVVFHAAALKHLTMLEQYPEEAWKTNVLGTQNVLDAAELTGVETFVNISTDKAVDPVCVLGRSKRIGERLVADTAGRSPGTYLSVRFGNVLGSRGSMLTTFTEQIASGGPITITHPDVTRFFMTIPEATQLVVHAAAIGRAGEALVLDMGSPVRIEDVAHHLMEIAGRSVPIVYTGLHAGEKLHESLFGVGECDHRPIHPAVSHVPVPPLAIGPALDHAARAGVELAMSDLLQHPSGRPAGVTGGVLIPLTRLPS